MGRVLPRPTCDYMVGATGFEPATLCSQSRCATKLRYAPNVMKYRVVLVALQRVILLGGNRSLSLLNTIRPYMNGVRLLAHFYRVSSDA
jgi:hypothetical protein